MTSDSHPQSAVTMFGVAHDLLCAAGCGGRIDLAGDARGADESRDAALRFLLALGYCQAGRNATCVDVTDTASATHGNRIALLGLAARFDRAFVLPARHAPGGTFFGAMAAPERFGIAGHPATGVGGRGLTLRQAFESCVGETAEYLSFISDSDAVTSDGANHEQFDGDDLAWITAGLGLPAGSDLSGLTWMAAQSIAGQRNVRFPTEMVLRLPPERRTVRRAAESSGVGAGPTREAAILSGLLEVMERDAVALWWHGGIKARPVRPELTADPDFESFIAQLRGDSGRIWWLLDIASDVGVPTCAALSAERDGRGVVVGFCTRPDARAAARSAVLEMCQMELAQELALTKLAQEGEAALAGQDKVWVARARDLSLANNPQLQAQAPARDIRDLPVTGDPLSAIVARLRARAFDAYVVDLIRSDLGIPVVRVIVPGLQPVRPDQVTPRLAAAARSNGRSLDGITCMTAPI